MIGSKNPVYQGEFAYVPVVSATEVYINDNVENSETNKILSIYSHGSPTNTAGDAEKMSDPSREEIQAKIEASEARNDTKIARLEGKLDLVLQTLQSSRDEARDNRRAIIANGWVIFGALIVVIGIVITVAPAVFDLGFRLRESITKEVQDRIPELTVPKNSK
jgi:hypothetical protein